MIKVNFTPLETRSNLLRALLISGHLFIVPFIFFNFLIFFILEREKKRESLQVEERGGVGGERKGES